MKVSVVIPVYNPGDIFRECLQELFNSDHTNFEVVIVDDCSIQSILPKDLSMPLKVVRTKKPSGPGVARNIGVKHAHGQILLFIDSDVIIERDTISMIVKRFRKDKELDAVSGFYNFRNRYNNLTSVYHNLYFEYKQKHIPLEGPYVDTAIWGVRKKVFDASGGFKKGLYTSEDLELGIRLYRKGHKLCSDKNIRVSHIKYATFRQWIRNRFCSCINMVMVKLSLPHRKRRMKGNEPFLQTILPHQIISPFLAWGLLFFVVFFLISGKPTVGVFAIATLLLYIIVNIRYIYFIMKKVGFRGMLLMPFVVLEHLITLVGVLFAFLRILLGMPYVTYRGTKR